MTTWTPIPIPPAPPYSDASSGRILLESGFPNFLLQEGGFPPIGILLEGSAITTTWTPVNTNP